MVHKKLNDRERGLNYVPNHKLSPLVQIPILGWTAILGVTVGYRLVRPDHFARTVLPLSFAVIAMIAVTTGLVFRRYFLVASGLVVSLGSPTVLVWYVWPLILLLALVLVVDAIRGPMQRLRQRKR